MLKHLLMERLLTKLESAMNQQPLNLDYLEFLTRHELILFESFSEQIGGITEITETLQNLHYLVQCNINDSSMPIVEHETEVGPGSGHPKIIIQKEHLKNLLDTHLPVACIAKFLGVSRRTVYRRMQEFDLSVRGTYSTMTDQELDIIISSIQSQMPNAGYRLVQGHLVSMGLRVQWWRMMASMHRVYATGIFSRLTEIGCPLSLVHIDTNHKLITDLFIIHVVLLQVLYLDAATNNRAKTAFSFFIRSAQLHGLPSRVRADQGVENLDIAHFMFATRGTGRSSFISGKSVHNQRVERMWRDVWVAVTSKYHDILHTLKEDGLLDISDATLLFGVHYVFVPRLWADLDTFIEGWNNHSFSYPVLTDMFCFLNLKDLQDPGIDWESAVLQEDSNGTVVVPEVECPLDNEALEELQRTINPLEHSESHGRDLYIRFLQQVSNQ
uniref:Integrase core domain-containing protein n=1 Tax=Amphiprion ocellaris TaxID=80972 RepID=A0A3Q1AXH4_AMPOC